MADSPVRSDDGADEGKSWEKMLPRDRLARLVVVASFLTLFLLVTTLLSVAQMGSPEATALAEKTFNIIIPVLAGWVGTVLAFYFSAQSQERTSRSLQTMIDRVSGPSAPTTPVSQIMIPLASVRGLQKIGDQDESDLSIAKLQDVFKSQDPAGPITRILVVTASGVFKYLIHSSTLNAYATEVLQASPSTTLADLKLADLLAVTKYADQVTKLVVFISATATVAQAKSALDATAGAQDVIVTNSGAAAEPVLGWVTNVDLIKALSAN